MRSERSIRVYLSAEEYDRLTAEATRRGLPASTYIRLIVLERLDAEDRVGDAPGHQRSAEGDRG